MYETYSYKGTIGDEPIHLNFYLPENWYNFDAGEYYYDKFKKNIELKGEVFRRTNNRRGETAENFRNG